MSTLTFKQLNTLTAAVLLTLASLPATADVLADIRGKCPSDYTPYVKHGRTHCKTPEKPQKQEKPSKSSSSSSSSGGTAYVEPLKNALAKPSATTRCPTGYKTDQGDELKCGTRMEDSPPRTALKSGACPAGTVEEWGAYCTAKPADVSDASIDKWYGYHIADFNMVYLKMQLARMPVDKLGDWEPEVLKAMKAERAAAGNPYKTASQRSQEKDAPAQAAAQKSFNDEAAAKDQSRNDAMRSACQQQMTAGIKSDACMEFAAAGGMTVAGAAAASPQEVLKDEAVKALGGLFKGLMKP